MGDGFEGVLDLVETSFRGEDCSLEPTVSCVFYNVRLERNGVVVSYVGVGLRRLTRESYLRDMAGG